MIHVQTDGATQAEIYQLTDGIRPADTAYAEQAYSSPGSRCIAVGHHAALAPPGPPPQVVLYQTGAPCATYSSIRRA